MLNYEELFAEGNIIGLRNTKLDYVFVHQIYSEKISNILKQEGNRQVNWDYYKNKKLSDTIFEIEWIGCFNDSGCLVKIFDRKTYNRKPKIKNGMTIWVKVKDKEAVRVGIVVDNKVYYQDDGWDYVINTLDPEDCIYDKIVAVFNEGYGFNCAGVEPIWRTI